MVDCMLMQCSARICKRGSFLLLIPFGVAGDTDNTCNINLLLMKYFSAIIFIRRNIARLVADNDICNAYAYCK